MPACHIGMCFRQYNAAIRGQRDLDTIPAIFARHPGRCCADVLCSRRYVFVVNPKGALGRAGRQWGELWPYVEEQAQQAGAIAEQRLTEFPGHAAEIARECQLAGYDVVVAVGGDGSINEVANGLLSVDQVRDGTSDSPCGSTWRQRGVTGRYMRNAGGEFHAGDDGARHRASGYRVRLRENVWVGERIGDGQGRRATRFRGSGGGRRCGGGDVSRVGIAMQQRGSRAVTSVACGSDPCILAAGL